MYQRRRPFHSKLTVLPRTNETYISIKVTLFCESCHVMDGETIRNKSRQMKKSQGIGNSSGYCGSPHIVIEFLDSYLYFNTSLQSLCDSFSHEVKQGIKSAEKHFHIVYDYVKNKGYLETMDFNFFIQKSYLPYDQWTSEEHESFLARKSLPLRESWKNVFWKKDEILDEKSYNFAQKIWAGLAKYYTKRGEEMTMRQYIFFYLELDVLILSQLQHSLSDYFFTIYKRDLNHYVSLPSFSNACFLTDLEKKGEKIELLQNELHSTFFRRHLIGGISVLGPKRILTSNRPDAPGFNPNKNMSVLTYVDINSLYSTTMKYPLAQSHYYLMSETEIQVLFTEIVENNCFLHWTDNYYKTEICPESGREIFIGLSLRVEVRLKPGREYHDKFDSFPLFPTRRVISDNELSPIQQKMNKELNRKGEQSQKIILDLTDKKDCTIDYRYLKFSLQNGYELVSIKQAMTYRQSAFINDYIDKNMFLRKHSKSKAEGSLYKLLCNTIYGSCLHDRVKHVSAELIFGREKCQNLIKNPCFQNLIEFSEDAGLGIKRKRKIMVTNCTPVAFGILSLSKLILLRNYYEVLEPTLAKSGAITTLSYSDTGER